MASEYELVAGETVDAILKKENDINSLEIEKRFIFIINEDLTKKDCKEYISKMQIENESILL